MPWGSFKRKFLSHELWTLRIISLRHRVRWEVWFGKMSKMCSIAASAPNSSLWTSSTKTLRSRILTGKNFKLRSWSFPQLFAQVWFLLTILVSLCQETIILCQFNQLTTHQSIQSSFGCQAPCFQLHLFSQDSSTATHISSLIFI